MADKDTKRITSLRASEYPQFDYAFAKRIKDNHPDIWGKGGNIRGNDAFALWTKARSGEKTEGVNDWFNEREAWAARHKDNKNLPGVVAQIKWGVIGSRGEAYMKDLVNDAIDRAKGATAESVDSWSDDVEYELVTEGTAQRSTPHVPVFGNVDIALLTEGDDNPTFIVLPIAELGRVSANGILYDDYLVNTIVSELPGLGGLGGHQRAEDFYREFPISSVHWVGLTREGNRVYAKGYVPPGERRDDLKRIKARGGGVGTSVVVTGKRVTETSGGQTATRFTDVTLHHIDLVPHKLASLRFDGAFELTSEMVTTAYEDGVTMAEDTAVAKIGDVTAQVKSFLSEMSDDALYEMMRTRLPKLSEMYANRERKAMVSETVYAELQTGASLVTEMQTTLNERQALISEMQASLATKETEIARLKQDMRNGEIRTRIESETAWNVSTDEQRGLLTNTRDVLYRTVVQEMISKPELSVADAVSGAVVANKPLLEMAVNAIAGGPAHIAPAPQQSASKIDDPDYQRASLEQFGLAAS